MSARPAFANLTTRSLTTFVGGINPWTRKPMPPRHQTAHLGSTPFVQAKAPKKNGPSVGAKYTGRVDLAALKIEDNVPLPRHMPSGKYADFFAGLKPKQSVKCKTELVLAIASGMRKYLKEAKLDATLTVIQQSTIAADPENGIEADPKHGRVWLWPKDGDAKSLPPGSRGGVAVGKARRAEKGVQA